jgi:hypothetical protein
MAAAMRFRLGSPNREQRVESIKLLRTSSEGTNAFCIDAVPVFAFIDSSSGGSAAPNANESQH